MTKQIVMRNGLKVLVDDDDFDMLIQWNWYSNKQLYAVRSIEQTKGPRTTLRMHRKIMGLENGDKRQVDHINGNRLDNRKSNLRICSLSENLRNTNKYANNSSGYKGARFHKRDKKWRARITVDGEQRHLGSFNSCEEAYSAYCDAAIKLHGEFANLGSGCVVLDKPC